MILYRTSLPAATCSLQEAQSLVEQLANSELTDEQRAWVQRLHELLDSLESNNSLGLFL
ncbi:hypothetical protein MTX78_07845 [Hymenobacter tibetensis]|uniref:PH domain-containing protein n=1 Tax=Hymenobacter tibetensis TaxID=497967 RepID=A0ABY4D2G7_9BACT|nr:hypothetical protein [Hymenobacter tibetensis]UOG76501.1 hypothetical protein MTX78_07845 [Hymenobacter tibetensis]